MSRINTRRFWIGIFTLVATCTLLAGWIRSPFLQDSISLHVHRSLCIQLISVSQHLIVAVLQIDTDQSISTPLWSSGKTSPTKWIGEFAGVPVTHPISEQSFATEVFEFGVAYRSMGPINTNVVVHSYQLPYWSIVVPLTLISSCLLISKPRLPKTSSNRGSQR